MEQKLIILSAKNWTMDNGTTGTTVWYIPESEQAVNADGSCGTTPVKQTLPFDFVDVIKGAGGAPVHCTAAMKIGTSGNRQTVLIDRIISFDNGKKAVQA